MKPVTHALFLAAMFATTAMASSMSGTCPTCDASAMLLVDPPAAAPGKGVHEHGDQPASKGEKDMAKEKAADPYLFDTCPVSGDKLGAMGKPVVKVYDGREVKFCCGSCPAAFEKDKAKGFAKIDEMIVKDQLPIYPLDTSVVSGKPLGAKDKAYHVVMHNRLVLLAAESEKGDLAKDWPKYLAALDKAVVQKQEKDYPLTTCVVQSDDKLGSMGEAKNFVVAGRLIRTCCADCMAKVEKDPAKYIKMVDEARAKKPAEGKAETK